MKRKEFMISRLAIAVTLLGWLIFVAHFSYIYVVHKEQIFKHLFQPTHIYESFAHILILIMPIFSTLLGYLIDERIRLNRGIIESEEKYHDLYQNAPDSYQSIASDGTILEVNDTWLKMLDYERDEVTGKMKLTEFLNDDGLKTFEKCFLVFKEKGHIENIEFDFRKKNGTFLPVIINAKVIYDKNGRFLRSRGIVRDNTAKKDYERSLRHSLSEWRTTFDSMPYGAMLIDRGFNITKINNYIAKIVGISINELIGRKYYEVIHGQDRPIEGCPVFRSVETNKATELEHYEPKLGIHFLINSTPVFDDEGFAIAYVASFVDITEIKDKEKKLSDSRDAFLNMLRDVNSAYTELKEIYNDFILAFVNTLDAKSPWTKGHSERVAKYALSIAKEMDLKEDLNILWMAAILHDIGKIGTYDTLLDKPEKLSEEELDLVRKHPDKGVEILKPIKGFKHIIPIIRSHHERLDGKGYPDGLKDDEIPFFARIICIADSFDSMTSDRPYRPAQGKEHAIYELKRYAGIQFDPQIVEAFLKVLERIDSMTQ